MRSIKVKRRTKETAIELELKLDGTGEAMINTGVAFFNHLLGAFATHGLFDVRVGAELVKEDGHHIVEDVGIALGKAMDSALGDRKGIRRFGDALVPMDDSLAMVAVDLGGRGYAVIDATFRRVAIEDLTSDLISHFLETFAVNGRFGLHASIMRGKNDHHKAEALFKALGVALCSATRLEARLKGKVPSQKGVLK